MSAISLGNTHLPLEVLIVTVATRKDEIIKKVEDLTRAALWNGSEWVADYRRLRAITHI